MPRERMRLGMAGVSLRSDGRYIALRIVQSFIIKDLVSMLVFIY